MTPSPHERTIRANESLGRFDDRDMDARLRRAFAGLEAPPRLELPAPRSVPASGRRVRWGLVAAAVVLFVLCAALPTIWMRWDPGLRAWQLLTPWVLRLAPALAVLAWVWLERAPARHAVEARAPAG